MNFSVTVSVIPLALGVLTVAALAWAVPIREEERDDGSMFGSLGAFSAVFRLCITVILCLAAWLAWALLR